MGIFWLVLSIGFWGLLHSLLASNGSKSLVRRVIGPRAERLYRLAYNLFAGVSLLPVAWLLVTLPDQTLYSVPLPWAIPVWILLALAVGTLAVGLLQTGVLSFLGLSSEDGGGAPRLVTGGLYRHVRHPLYTSGLAILWISPSMTVNRLAVNAALTVYILVGASLEEGRLRGVYGRAYLEYAAKTPMWVPVGGGNNRQSRTS